MNPYHYGTPVSGEQFAGREAETAGLLARMRDGINVVVISPRRYGKTSLLARASGELTERGGSVVEVNVLRCRDATTLAGRLATAAYRMRGARWHRMRQAVPEFLRRLRVAPSVTFDGEHPRFTFSPGLAAEDVDSVLADVYAALAEQAQRRPAVLVLDEFQAITGLGVHLPALFKALADAHPEVALVLAGSKKHLMERLVTAADAPLYRMAERFALEPLPEAVMIEFLRRRAADGAKTMSEEAAAGILQLAGPVPNDIQHLAYETFNVAAGRIALPDVELGLARAVAHEAALHADRFESLASGQRRVLAELAAQPTREPFAAAFGRRVSLAGSGSVRRALDALLAAELIAADGGCYRVADPFFAAWLRQGV